MSGSKTLLAFENLIEKTPLGGQGLRDIQEKAVEGIKGLRDKLAARLGTREDANVLDEMAQNAVKAAKQAHSKEADALFSRVGELAQGSFIEFPRQAQAAASLLEKELALAPNRRNEKIIGMAADVLGIDAKDSTPEMVAWIRQNPTAHALDFNNFRGNRRLLGDIIDGDSAARAMGSQYSSAESGAAKLLFKEGEKDLAAFSKKSGGELEKAFDAANSFYRDGRAIYDSKTIKTMIRTEPGRLARTIIRPDESSVNAIRAVKAAAGGEGQAGWQAIKKQFVETLIPEVEGGFSPQNFQKILDKYPEPVLREVFSPKELMEFKGLARVSAQIGKAASIHGTQGSARSNVQVANYVLGSASGVTGLILGGPAGALAGSAGVILGPKALSKLYLSPTGRKLLLEGFKTTIDGKRAAQVGTAITTYLGAKSLGESEHNP